MTTPSDLTTTLQQLCDHGVLSFLDLHFAQFIHRLNQQPDQALLLGAVLSSHFTAQGHICLHLPHLAGQTFPPMPLEDIPQITCPPLTAWREALQNSAVVGVAGEYKPLILEQDRLYLYRYWHYEQQLAQQLLCRLQQPVLGLDPALLEQALQHLFADTHADEQQREAARRAVLQQFCIISGGPGTGKTWTVVRILALLLTQQPHLHIALAAPTGKAAARLEESISAALPQLHCTESIKQRLPSQASTLHRLLGSRLGSPYFRHSTHNPLLHDVVVVDEASMVDLALMTKLVQALKPTARLILLGDRDQLASVEAGTVLGDLCQLAESGQSLLTNSLVLLEKSHRFKADSGIGQVAQAVRLGEAERALQILQHTTTAAALRWEAVQSAETLLPQLSHRITQGFQQYLSQRTALAALTHFNQFRILCATRHGPFGVIAINRLVEQVLSVYHGLKPTFRWYHGRPIMITRNDYHLRLFNGDIGLILWLPGMNEPQAFFPDATAETGVRAVWPNRLPEHETVYAMTIHKSQGSEFDEVLLLLPEQSSNLLTRELLYTGITRARHRLQIFGNTSVIKTAVAQRIQRSSGLSAVLQDCA